MNHRCSVNSSLNCIRSPAKLLLTYSHTRQSNRLLVLPLTLSYSSLRRGGAIEGMTGMALENKILMVTEWYSLTITTPAAACRFLVPIECTYLHRRSRLAHHRISTCRIHVMVCEFILNGLIGSTKAGEVFYCQCQAVLLWRRRNHSLVFPNRIAIASQIGEEHYI